MSESQQEPEICDVIAAKRYWQDGRISLPFSNFCLVGTECNLTILLLFLIHLMNATFLNMLKEWTVDYGCGFISSNNNYEIIIHLRVF